METVNISHGSLREQNQNVKTLAGRCLGCIHVIDVCKVVIVSYILVQLLSCGFLNAAFHCWKALVCIKGSVHIECHLHVLPFL